MFFYIFLTHGDFGRILLETARNIIDEDVSEKSVVYSMDYTMSYEVENVKENVKKSVGTAISKGYKVIIFVDIFGGSPSNVAFTIAKQENLDVVSGVNLAMIMYAIEHIDSDKDMESMVAGILRTGSQNITSAKKLLGNKAKTEKG